MNTSPRKSEEKLTTEEKKSRRNEIVICPICKKEMPRKKLKTHKNKNHKPIPELIIKNREFIQCNSWKKCENCEVISEKTWEFEATTRGKVNLCRPCKDKILKYSFSPETREKLRVNSLKDILRELKKKKAQLPAGTVDISLIKNIVELEDALKNPRTPKPKWSPIMPGSFEGGKRR